MVCNISTTALFQNTSQWLLPQLSTWFIFLSAHLDPVWHSIITQQVLVCGWCLSSNSLMTSLLSFSLVLRGYSLEKSKKAMSIVIFAKGNVVVTINCSYLASQMENFLIFQGMIILLCFYHLSLNIILNQAFNKCSNFYTIQ